MAHKMIVISGKVTLDTIINALRTADMVLVVSQIHEDDEIVSLKVDFVAQALESYLNWGRLSLPVE